MKRRRSTARRARRDTAFGVSRNRRPANLIPLSLILLTLVVYSRALYGDFVTYHDDGLYLTKNPNVQHGMTTKALLWAFTTGYAANWHPLTWMSHMVDYALYGPNAWGHHLTSVLLHIGNALLLFVVLRDLTGSRWRSGFVAALFAIHPLHVESVAWIAERKDVLSGFLWMMTILAYVRYTRQRSSSRYLVVVVTYALGLMAKPMLVTLPFVLLLLDHWPLNRLRPADARGAHHYLEPLWEKGPLFGLAAASGVITYVVQQQAGAVGSFERFPLMTRIANAVVASATYMWQMVWPRGLSILYPHPGQSLPMWQVAAAIAMITGITALAIARRRTQPYIVVGWLWYLITLLPVIGLVQVGEHSMADRYTYIPLIGLFIAITWGVSDLLIKYRVRPEFEARERRSRYEKEAPGPIPRILIGGATVVIVVLAVCSCVQVGYWKDNTTLFARALSINPRNHLAHYEFGVHLCLDGDFERGIYHMSKATELKVDWGLAHNNLAVVLTHAGDYARAWTELRLAQRYGHQPDPTLLRILSDRMPGPSPPSFPTR